MAKANAIPEKVTIKLPKIKGEGDEQVWVNDESWLIKRGVEVEVPACVAEVLSNQEAALEVMYKYEDKASR